MDTPNREGFHAMQGEDDDLVATVAQQKFGTLQKVVLETGEIS